MSIVAGEQKVESHLPLDCRSIRLAAAGGRASGSKNPVFIGWENGNAAVRKSSTGALRSNGATLL
jgi:hypothetical protein